MEMVDGATLKAKTLGTAGLRMATMHSLSSREKAGKTSKLLIRRLSAQHLMTMACL